jgi:DNA modification methylase
MSLERWAVDRLKPYPRNARTHSDAQIEQIAASIREFGWTNPILVDKSGIIRAGHGRLLAAKRLGIPEVPVLVLDNLTDAQLRAYVIADNKLAEGAGWDDQLLASELAALRDDAFDLSVIGFSDDELSNLLADMVDAPSSGAPGGEADAVPEVRAEAVTRTGELWILGRHRLLCGDSTNRDHVGRLMNGRRAALVHADPPYGMGKEADGVVNDNLYAEKLDAFQLAWWAAWRPFLTDNASAYIWGNAPDLWRLWYSGGLGKSEALTLRNEIVWDKKSIAGMASPDLTQYPEATERCLFFQIGRHVLLINQTKDDYWAGWEPIRLWLCAERDRMGWSASDVRWIVQNHMHGHWFGTSQWSFISRENYDKLATAAKGQAFTRDYSDLRAEYQALLAEFNGDVRGPRRQEFNAVRPYFDNAHDIMRDVWEFSRVTGEERHGHATPKPVAMMERVMKASARPGELAVEPFGGSGSTLIGAETTGRACYVMEVMPEYVDVIVRRWQKLTGRAAVLEGTSRTFADLEAERVRT